MIDSKFEVPDQVRDLALRNVEQAAKAVSSFMESAGKSVAAVPGPMTELAKQALAITEKNLKASFEHARKLMQATDLSEVMRLQSEFVRNQFGEVSEQLRQMASGPAAASNEIEKT
jgi:phasin